MKTWAHWTTRPAILLAGVATAAAGLAAPGLTGTAFAAPARAGSGPVNAGNIPVLSGNNLSASVAAPVDVCGNAVGLLGFATAGCQGGATAWSQPAPGHRNPQRARLNAGNVGVGSGNRIRIPVSAPVDVCGNVVGNGRSSCHGGAQANAAHGPAATSQAGGSRPQAASQNPLAASGFLSGVTGLLGSAGLSGLLAAPTSLLGGVSGLTGR